MDKDYTTYTGKVLERYFLAKMIESEEYTQIASWWDRKGENEIDLIAADELEQKVTFYEVKRQAKDINLGILKDKAEHFFQATGKFKNTISDIKACRWRICKPRCLILVDLLSLEDKWLLNRVLEE